MKNLVWDTDKDMKLKIERDVGFEEVIEALLGDGFLNIEKNPSNKYPYQKIYIVRINNYVYLVPFVEDKEKVFLKTIIPSRKATKKYITN